MAAVWGAALLALLPNSARAQDGSGAGSWSFLPEVRLFPSPVADPLEPHFAIGLVRTDLFERRGPERPLYLRSPGTKAEMQAAAAIGTTIPVLYHAWPGGGLLFGATAGVFARFRIQLPSRDDLSEDWAVGMPVEMAWGPTAVRLRIIHRSSHLGDEFSQSTGGQRIEMGGEAIDGMLARNVAGLRIYGGGGWVFHSNTDNTEILIEDRRQDRFTLQAGADARLHPFASHHWMVTTGADWQSAERSAWQSSYALAAGVHATRGGRNAGLLLRYLGGNSYVGQFFLTPERVVSLELLLNY